MPTLPNMGLITPTLGGDSGAWDDKINAAFELVDAHDHTTGKGVRVPVAGLNINANLSMGGLSLTSTGSIDFTAIAAPSSGSKRLFVNSSDNELYWRTNAGTNVKLTSGTSINTTLVGGIVGDYSSVGAELAYDDANKRYTFKQETGTWARLASGPVRIYQFDTTESVYVEHAVAAALAASYTVTWPAAAAGSQLAMQIAADGSVVFSNTFTQTVIATDFHYTLSQDLLLAASAAIDVSGSHTRARNYILLAASANQVVWPVPVRGGETITGWAVYLEKNTTGGAVVTAQLYKTDGTDGTESTVGTSDTNNDAGVFVVLVENGLSQVCSDGEQYYLVFTPSGSVAGAADKLYNATVSVKRV